MDERKFYSVEDMAYVLKTLNEDDEFSKEELLKGLVAALESGELTAHKLGDEYLFEITR